MGFPGDKVMAGGVAFLASSGMTFVDNTALISLHDGGARR